MINEIYRPYVVSYNWQRCIGYQCKDGKVDEAIFAASANLSDGSVKLIYFGAPVDHNKAESLGYSLRRPHLDIVNPVNIE